jgi:hypothetical protein
MEGVGIGILRQIGPFFGHLIYFVVIWYILWLSGTFFLFLVHCNQRDLATLSNSDDAQFRGKRESRRQLFCRRRRRTFKLEKFDSDRLETFGRQKTRVAIWYLYVF